MENQVQGCRTGKIQKWRDTAKTDAYPEDDSRQSSREENPWYDLKGLDEVEKTLRLQMEITTHGSMN